MRKRKNSTFALFFLKSQRVGIDTSVEEFQSRIIETQKQFPWLVCEMNTEIVGYAYANIHRSRSAYDWSVESTVYVSDRHQSKGVGKALYQTLFKLLKGQGIVNIIAGITLPNPNSVRLHEKLGFVQIGQLKGIGFKFDQWWDVGWWQLQLQNPLRPKSLSPYSKEF
ncbi:MAG: N-acetyltransferase family protein [Bdellovibrionia bacterium]